MALQTWNGRAASQTDADSPPDMTLLDGIRKDLNHLRQVLYGSTDPNFNTPAWGHDHDGTNSKLVLLESQSVGNYLFIENAIARQANYTTSWVRDKETKVGVGGAFRIKYTMSGLGPTYSRIFRNGVPVGTVRGGNGSSATYSEDISGWSPGDLVQVYCKSSGGASQTISDFNIYTAAPQVEGANINY